ncbi:hypothetical protein V5799_033909 [Amblyomma americanum]|uniref:Uncharacterized protein n=1 Tax=Amblyomma americanum TaxID=6943 RepID=A0AAQ4DLZ4_AMBAM
MEAMVRNLYYFFHVVLNAAHKEPLWTRNSFERSIQWAKYCEKVYNEAISKGYASDVAMLLKDMNKLTAGRRVVAFDDLKISSQLLVAELLQCPALREGTVQIILNSQLIEEPWLEETFGRCSRRPVSAFAWNAGSVDSTFQRLCVVT